MSRNFEQTERLGNPTSFSATFVCDRANNSLPQGALKEKKHYEVY